MSMGLLQRKVAALEEKIADVVHKEAEWGSSIERVGTLLEILVT